MELLVDQGRRRPFRGIRSFLFLAVSILFVNPHGCHAFVAPSNFRSTTQASHAHSTVYKRSYNRFSPSIDMRKEPGRLEAYNSHDWEGDDIRWTSRMRRRFRQALRAGTYTRRPAQTSILLLNIAVFLYQTMNTVDWIRRRHPEYWPSQSVAIVVDALLGSAVPGPLTRGFAHSVALSSRQPHRYLTAGFLHGGLVHLVLNMDALRRLPSWLETGLGSALYLTTFLVSIITGMMGHSFMTYNSMDRTMCLGASGGICGLYGLMYVSLVRMGNAEAASRIMKGMGLLLLYGILVTSTSNAAHVGGFLGGLVVGFLCGPSYRTSYSARRKWSLDVDAQPRDYRYAMGFGTKPTDRGILPCWALWVVGIGALLSQPQYRRMPRLILKGLLHPGSLTGIS